MTSRSVSRTALIAFLAYGGVSAIVGERFPFSNYDMYASAGGRNEGAVLTTIADGMPASLEDFERIGGIDPAGIYPPGIPCSMEYRVAEASRYLRAHQASSGDPPGPVRLQLAYRIVSISNTRLDERLLIVAEGTAWRK